MDSAQPFITENRQPVEKQSSFGCCPAGLSLKKVIVGLAIILGLMIIWQFVNSPTIVTVYGIGEVSVPATNATLTTTISTNADTAQEAISSVKVRSQVIRDLLIGSGIAEGDIAESQVTAYPAGLITAGANGFQASLQISAKTVHVSTVGDLIAALYSAGATLVEQPVLSVENQEELEKEASKEALKDAKSQISKIAWKNFKPIRKMIALTEETSSTTSTATIKADILTEEQDNQAALNGVFKIAKVATVSYKLW